MHHGPLRGMYLKQLGSDMLTRSCVAFRLVRLVALRWLPRGSMMDDEVGMYEARTRFAELLTEVENDGVLLSPVTVIL